MLLNLIIKMNKRGRAFVYLSLLLPSQVFATDIDTLKSRCIQKIDLPIPAEENILTYQNNNLFFVSSSESLDQNQLLWVFDINKPNNLLKIKLHKKILSQYRITAIGGSKNKLVLLSHDSIFFYQVEKNSAKMYGAIGNQQSFKGVDFTENNTLIVLHKLYNFHPLDQKVRCQYVYLNAEDLQEVSNDTFDYKGILYSHQIHKWQQFHSNESYSLMALTAQNGILRLNRFKHFDTIFLPSQNKVFVPDSLLNLPARGKQMISQLMAKDMLYNRIEKIFWSNDTLIISEIFPGSGKEKRLITFACPKQGHYTFKEYIYNNTLQNHESYLNLSYSYPMFVYGNQIISINQWQVKNENKKKPFQYCFYIYQFEI